MTGTDSLVPEHPDRFRAQMFRVRREQAAMASDIRSVEPHMAGSATAELDQDAGLSALMLRVERIEPRPDPVD